MQRTIRRENFASEIGVVQQRSILFRGSIRDNLKWGNDQASDEDLWKAITIAQAKDVVEAKPGKLDFEVEQNGRNLSGGQKQRLTIARALVSKPEILILDDSLSALDFATDAALRKAIGELEGNVTTFLVSQRISGIRQADKILVMEDGELAGQGTHEELMETCETYQEIYYSQFPEERPAAVKSSKETGKDLDKADKMNREGRERSGRVMKKLLKLIGKYKIFLAFSVIFAAISVVLQLYVPVLFGDAIDEVVSAHQVNFDMCGII